jgi:hypothetical protein
MVGFKGKKMLGILNHLDDCHFTHYSLQMSIYMWIMLQHNPKAKPGSLTIYHIKFLKEAEDQNGYPVITKDKNGDYVVDNITPITVPYLEKEVLSIVQQLQTYL